MKTRSQIVALVTFHIFLSGLPLAALATCTHVDTMYLCEITGGLRPHLRVPLQLVLPGESQSLPADRSAL